MAANRHRAVQSRTDHESERRVYALEHMSRNKAYRYAVEARGGDPHGEILAAHSQRYLEYRQAWRGNPQKALEQGLYGEALRDTGLTPMCVDIEVAAVCDLACPFCFRQWIATPDKIIREDLCYRLIDQCAELGVPSIKLNWRGEPLLHPRLADIIDYAKRKAILEVIINSNAVTLDEAKARSLIEAGLDLMIYSFDGGTKATYDAMRIGRFRENRFEEVYRNIRRFAEIRADMQAVLPRTQVQMVLTEETFGEQDAFFDLFEDCVDDVSVKAYTERGGSLPDLDPDARARLSDSIREHGVPEAAAYWRDLHGALYLAKGRLPCEQPFQRLMVTYDGQVSMCCYDWGGEYPIGYVDAKAFENGRAEYATVIDAIQSGKAGFADCMAEARLPKPYVEPPRTVQTLAQIWHGEPINDVRKKHLNGAIEDVPICTRCPFKETYDWIRVEGADTSAAA